MIVLATNIVSYIFGESDIAGRYVEQLRGQRALISFQTWEELWYGVYSGGWGERRRGELARHLDQDEVIWPNTEIADVCARLRSNRKAAGRPIAEADAWIAATAIVMRCPLASEDRTFSDIPELMLLS